MKAPRTTAQPILVRRASDCSGCSACAAICPQRAVLMELGDRGFTYPRINPALCIGCMKCVLVCPIRMRDDKSDEPKTEQSERERRCENPDQKVQGQTP